MRYLKNTLKTTAARLALIAGMSGLIYLALFTLPFPLPRYYATIPPVDYAKLTNYSPLGLAAYVVGLLSLFWLYWQAIRLTKPTADRRPPTADRRPPTAERPMTRDEGRTTNPLFLIFATSFFLTLVSLFAYPLTAIDLFVYAIRSRGWALYGLNPLATAPERLPPADPWLGLAAEWVDAASPYGPLWEIISLGVFHLSGGEFLAHLLGLKLVMTLAYLGCVWLIYQILQRWQPAWAIAGTLAFAWNPLVLLESVQNGHNDILMMLFWLAAVWVLSRQRLSQPVSTGFSWQNSFGGLALICLLLALSILIKFVTILTIPFFLLAMTVSISPWPRRLAVMTGCGLLIAALVIIPMWPLWPGWENWAVLEAGSQAGRSLLALLVLGLRDSLGTNLAFDLARNGILLVFALIYLYYLWRGLTISRGSAVNRQPSTKSPNLQSPISQSPNLPRPAAPLLLCFPPLFWYVLLAAPVFHAWYLLWVAPLAGLLLPDRRPLIATLIFSMTALLVIPYFETIRVWVPFLLQNQFLGHLIGVPLLILPPALAMLWPIRPSQSSEVS